MEIIYGYLINAAAILITFSIVVFVHELGHLITALKAGVEVKTFSLGFGREIAGFTRKGIRYRISAVPLGGYVKMKGEDPAEEGAKDRDALMGLEPFKRIGVLFSGAGMNFLTGALIFSALIFFTGIERIVDEPIVGSVLDDTPAMEAGIEEGDRIIEIGEEPVKSWMELSQKISSMGEDEFRVKLERDGRVKFISITARMDPEAGRALIGVAPAFETVRAGFFSSLKQGFAFTGLLIWRIVQSLYLMATRRMEAEVSGPIGIARHVSEAARYGLDRLLWIIALISVNLGLINLFPIPVLDGGHIMFAFIEKIKGSPVREKTLHIANVIGLSIIIALMLYVFWFDIFGGAG